MREKESHDELLDRIEERARYYEKEYHGCSQCTLLALQEHLELGDGGAFKAATPLIGGIALAGDVCGAVIGGLMAIGLIYGRERIEDTGKIMETLRPASLFCSRFEKEFGNILCRELHQRMFGRWYDMRKDEDYAEYRRIGGYEKCANLAGKAARMAGELILQGRG